MRHRRSAGHRIVESHDTKPKVERNATVVALYGTMPPREIARQFNISRSRVYDIVYRERENT